MLLAAGHAAIYWHRLPTGHPAANQPHAAAAVDRWDTVWVVSMFLWYMTNCYWWSKSKTAAFVTNHTTLATHTHTHPFNCAVSETTWVSRYQKGKTSLDFTEARDSEWQWHPLGHMQVSTSLQTENHVSPPLSFLQARCPSCHPTNSVKALKASTT